MQTNGVPPTDGSDNPTGCCSRFNPDGWDAQALHFDAKPFVRAVTHSVNQVPTDMAAVFGETMRVIDASQAWDEHQALVLSRDVSPSESEHLFAVRSAVPGAETVQLDGDFRTKVFEGAYASAPQWKAAFERDLAAQGLTPHRVYFYYTTCPKCAAFYGKNYVVAVAQLRA